MVRKLEHYVADQAKREGDDRNLVSRTEERRENQRVEAERLALATRLTTLKDRHLDRLDLSEHCRTIIDEIRIIDSAPARARAIKRLRAELRDVDAEKLERSIDALGDPHTIRPVDAATAWCSRLLGGGDADLAEFVELYPSTDRARLRALVRNRLRAKEPEQKRTQTKLLEAVRAGMRESPQDSRPAVEADSSESTTS